MPNNNGAGSIIIFKQKFFSSLPCPAINMRTIEPQIDRDGQTWSPVTLGKYLSSHTHLIREYSILHFSKMQLKTPLQTSLYFQFQPNWWWKIDYLALMQTTHTHKYAKVNHRKWWRREYEKHNWDRFSINDRKPSQRNYYGKKRFCKPWKMMKIIGAAEWFPYKYARLTSDIWVGAQGHL